MDEVDIANELAAQDLALRIAAARVRRVTMGPELCEACEDPIPMVRRQLGLVLCIECARARERMARQFSSR